MAPKKNNNKKADVPEAEDAEDFVDAPAFDDEDEAGDDHEAEDAAEDDAEADEVEAAPVVDPPASDPRSLFEVANVLHRDEDATAKYDAKRAAKAAGVKVEDVLAFAVRSGGGRSILVVVTAPANKHFVEVN